MKFIALSLISLSALSLITSCTFVDTPESASRTTTTSQSAPSIYGTTKTTTTRTY